MSLLKTLKAKLGVVDGEALANARRVAFQAVQDLAAAKAETDTLKADVEAAAKAGAAAAQAAVVAAEPALKASVETAVKSVVDAVVAAVAAKA